MSTSINGRYAALIVALIVLTVTPAVVGGLWSGRWRDPADMSAAARRLVAFPTQFGDWRQRGDEEAMPREAVDELQCAGYFNRRYVNQKLGREVTVMLMVGPSGPLVRHPPEICYGNRANKLVRDPAVVTVRGTDGQSHSLRLLRFKSPSAAAGEFSVCYGWTEDGSWSVPDYPRLRFGGSPQLYKLQVLSTDSELGADGLSVATSRFLGDFLPAMRDALLANRN